MKCMYHEGNFQAANNTIFQIGGQHGKDEGFVGMQSNFFVFRNIALGRQQVLQVAISYFFGSFTHICLLFF